MKSHSKSLCSFQTNRVTILLYWAVSKVRKEPAPSPVFFSMGKPPIVCGGHSAANVRIRHYDVIAASSHGWDSPPFVLTGRNGYLYGRGASDDKGPILAVACAASKLLAKRMLGADVIMLVEGEEEAGSTGFKEVVRKYKVCHLELYSKYCQTVFVGSDRARGRDTCQVCQPFVYLEALFLIIV